MTPREGTVEVYALHLEVEPELLAALRGHLTEDERARADRFLREQDRRRFTVSQGRMRQLLGSRLGCTPEQVPLARAERGKPFLPHSRLRFNLTHSHELALCALCLDAEVGVDVEYSPRPVEYEALARRFFSRPEADKLLSAPVEQRRRAFFNGWTRKEAYIKAIGEGLSRPLDSFQVGLLPEEPAELLWSRFPEELERWSLRALVVPQPYVAALVVEGRNWNILPLTEWPSKE